MMAEKKGNYLIPFDHLGIPQPYPMTTTFRETSDGPVVRHDPEWRENKPFEATLAWDGFYRGRSAAGACFRDSLGTPYVMFMTDLDKCVKYLRDGRVQGLWRFTKRGQNYGVQLVEAYL